MTREIIETKVRAILSEQLKVDPARIKPESTFAEMEADSLGVIELLLLLEDEFGVNIPNGSAKDFKTLGDLLTYLEANAQSQAA